MPIMMASLSRAPDDEITLSKTGYSETTSTDISVSSGFELAELPSPRRGPPRSAGSTDGEDKANPEGKHYKHNLATKPPTHPKQYEDKWHSFIVMLLPPSDLQLSPSCVAALAVECSSVTPPLSTTSEGGDNVTQVGGILSSLCAVFGAILAAFGRFLRWWKDDDYEETLPDPDLSNIGACCGLKGERDPDQEYPIVDAFCKCRASL